MYNFIFLYYGLLAILAQLLIFRELSVLFYGNELFLGTFLSSWFFWVGLGSLLARRFLKRERLAAEYFSYGFLALSLLLPLVILLIRLSKNIFAFGEFIGPLGTIFFTFCIMSFLCFVIGAQFSLACAVASGRIKRESALGQVYFCEALGSVIGGVFFTYILIGYVSIFTVALVLSFVAVFVSWSLLGRKVSIKRALLAVSALLLLFIGFKIEPAVNKIEWRRYQFIQQKEARNATLSLVKMGSTRNVFADGVLSASFPNPENYEPAAHWPLLAAADPGRILVLGDFSLGMLKEVLKHNPEFVDYVVLDNSFLDMIKPYLEPEDSAALNDPRVRIHYGDSRFFVKKSKEKYNAVVINIQEVPNLKLNRLYTHEFYVQIGYALKPGGILALSVASSENYLSMQTRMFNASVYRTLKSVFDTVEVIPGDTIMFLSSASAIDLRKETIMERFMKRGISNHYVIPSYIEYKLAVKRRAELKKILEETPRVEIDRDFKPTAYYYFTDFWLSKFTSPPGYLVIGVLLAAAFFSIFNKRRSLVFLARRKECVLIFILGFLGILLELMLLLGFQIISGYVYWQMGILFASFMLGLFAGALLGARLKHDSRQRHFIFLVILSLSIIILAVSARCFLPYLINLSTAQNIIIFTAILILIGVVMGAAFVVAGFLISEDEIMVKAGDLYAADLWGAAAGAMLSTNLIVPLFGFLGALNFSAVTGLMGLSIFLILSKAAKA